MSAPQLQKFTLHLIAEHCAEVIPTAHRLISEISEISEINGINEAGGAPDPTAGPSEVAEDRWFLDEKQIAHLIRHYLQHTPSMDEVGVWSKKIFY